MPQKTKVLLRNNSAEQSMQFAPYIPSEARNAINRSSLRPTLTQQLTSKLQNPKPQHPRSDPSQWPPIPSHLSTAENLIQKLSSVCGRALTSRFRVENCVRLASD